MKKNLTRQATASLLSKRALLQIRGFWEDEEWILDQIPLTWDSNFDTLEYWKDYFDTVNYNGMPPGFSWS